MSRPRILLRERLGVDVRSLLARAVADQAAYAEGAGDVTPYSDMGPVARKQYENRVMIQVSIDCN